MVVPPGQEPVEMSPEVQPVIGSAEEVAETLRGFAHEGIAQVLFFRGEEPPEVSYADKRGKYQKQHGVTLPRL